MSVTITTHTDPKDTATVKVAGEVDVSSAAEFREGIFSVLEGGLKTLVLDISALSYIDSTGIGVLVGAAHYAAEHGIDFTLLNPQKNVCRVLGLLGLDTQLHLVSSDGK